MLQIPRPVLIVPSFVSSSEWLREEIKAVPKTLSIEKESYSDAYNSRESDLESDSDK